MRSAIAAGDHRPIFGFAAEHGRNQFEVLARHDSCRLRRERRDEVKRGTAARARRPEVRPKRRELMYDVARASVATVFARIVLARLAGVRGERSG